MTASPEKLRLFRSVNARLTSLGRHPCPGWWDGDAEHQYLHPTAHRHFAEVGRGGWKSTFGLRVAETEMLSHWGIPLNERHYFAWVSENVEEASQRPRQIEQDLLDLGVPCTRVGNTVDIDGQPIGFKAFPCRVGAVSGFRAFGFLCDEQAKWENGDGANPAKEVVASLRAMTVTHRDAREWHLSSPWTKDTFHYLQCDLGDTASQTVARGIPSWLANPGAITEERTRLLEPDHATWLREYAAVASDSISTNWFGSALDGASDPGRMLPGPWREGVDYCVSVDQSESVDRYGIAVLSFEVGDWDEELLARRPPVLRVHETHSWVPDRSPTKMILRIRDEILLRYHQPPITIDQFGGAYFRDLCVTVGVRARVVKWTGGSGEERDAPGYRRDWGDPAPQASRTARYRMVRLAMQEGTFRLPDDPTLVREFRSVRGHLTPSGNETIVLPRSAGGHCDRVSSIVLGGSVLLQGHPDLPRARETRSERKAREAHERAQQDFIDFSNNGGF